MILADGWETSKQEWDFDSRRNQPVNIARQRFVLYENPGQNVRALVMPLSNPAFGKTQPDNRYFNFTVFYR